MKIGYVRVSKQEQNEELQIDALKEAGCDKWFLNKMTGSKAERKGLTGKLTEGRTDFAPRGGNLHSRVELDASMPGKTAFHQVYCF